MGTASAAALRTADAIDEVVETGLEDTAAVSRLAGAISGLGEEVQSSCGFGS